MVSFLLHLYLATYLNGSDSILDLAVAFLMIEGGPSEIQAEPCSGRVSEGGVYCLLVAWNLLRVSVVAALYLQNTRVLHGNRIGNRGRVGLRFKS